MIGIEEVRRVGSGLRPGASPGALVQKLGLELPRDDDSVPGIRWVQIAPTGAGASLTLVTRFESMPPGSLRGLVLDCDDLDRTYQRLVTDGVEVDRELIERPWGKEAVIRDPDRNRLAPAAVVSDQARRPVMAQPRSGRARRPGSGHLRRPLRSRALRRNYDCQPSTAM